MVCCENPGLGQGQGCLKLLGSFIDALSHLARTRAGAFMNVAVCNALQVTGVDYCDITCVSCLIHDALNKPSRTEVGLSCHVDCHRRLQVPHPATHLTRQCHESTLDARGLVASYPRLAWLVLS